MVLQCSGGTGRKPMERGKRCEVEGVNNNLITDLNQDTKHKKVSEKKTA